MTTISYKLEYAGTLTWFAGAPVSPDGGRRQPGRATYQPGWKWSEHNSALVGTALCHAPHTGVVISGHGVVLYETGERLDLLPGQAFHITSTPHDSWVEGNQPYVSLHLLSPPPA